MIKRLIVDKESEDTRLDVYLFQEDGEKSRSHYQKIIAEGMVLVNGKKTKSNYKVKTFDQVEVEHGEEKQGNLIKEDIELCILYEDEDILVVNKPQNMVVHPAPGSESGTLVNGLLNHCESLSTINGDNRPGIVHRIDKDTSGILVVAKNDYAHIKLSEQLRQHSMKRIYVALCEGVIKENSITIDKPIGRDKKNRLKKAIDSEGREAVTHVTVMETFDNYTLVQCRLETGRTHQIRVHMASIGHPIVGDPLYGFKKQKFKLEGQVLHAMVLGFIHPKTGEYMEFSSEIPEYFKELLRKIS
ncbi:ribosomal large subunit pseudouridine synthase D [Hathewaya proteolytica DSM 3090]|uniref:Pseudouridine synthase n=1 Tax=Hathewaya proteolytica DSM 3090 TaxID=1121331 RepID=A0A1M6L6V0_9CLOT|nr:RluA family pseudouridine synthase [Hathewaya proteolytica]SHJ66789.1 ribosomal large subunit pseudouridine synthase D [Hathewaya proteolytica DSM 3090]